MSHPDSNPLIDSSTVSRDEGSLAYLIRKGHSFSGRERNCCFLNRGNGSFANISGPSGLDFAEDGRGVAVVDWDQDGDLDFWISNRNAPQIRFEKNVVPRENSYLALRLVGTECNRDAIGARVVVHTANADSPPVAQTLRAGAGYLSQSSKWLHFGLGKNTAAVRVVVHWPGGGVDEFRDIAPNRRYRLTQGQSQPEELAGKREKPLNIEPSTLVGRSPTAGSELLLSNQFSLPPLSYLSGTEKKETLPIAIDSERPKLVILWASWCTPCLKELAGLTKRQKEIDAAGLDILALSVDGLGTDKTKPGMAKKTLERLKFPFSHGTATLELLSKLQIVHDEIFARYDPLPVPTSFLISGQGRLAAIYKGPVEIETLLSHVSALSLDETALRDESHPFVGKWFHALIHHSPLLLAKRLSEEGFVDEAISVLDKPHQATGYASGQAQLHMNLAAELVKRGDAAAAIGQLQRAIGIEPKFGTVYFNLGLVYESLGRQDEALQSFLQAVERSPELATAQYKIGVAMQERGEIDRAIEHWTKAIETNPQQPGAHFNLGLAWKQKGETEKLIEHFRLAIEANPNDPAAHFLLAEGLESMGHIKEAVDQYRKVVQLNAKDLSTAARLAWILSTHSEEQVRDGDEAIKLARRVCEATQYKNPQILDVLAAACAEAGQFDQAIKFAEQALQIKPTQEKVARAIEARLKLYRKKKPFRMAQ